MFLFWSNIINRQLNYFFLCFQTLFLLESDKNYLILKVLFDVCRVKAENSYSIVSFYNFISLNLLKVKITSLIRTS